MHSELWIEEKLEDYLGIRYRVENVLFSGESEYQRVDVVETRGHGRMLLNDDLVMVSERDEVVYHLVDSTDPIGPAKPLFGPEFYANVFNILSDNGIVVSQEESPFYEGRLQTSLLKILSGLFSKVAICNYSNLTYPGGLWSFTFASKTLNPIDDFDQNRVEQSGLDCKYYTPDIHRAAFCLPAFMRENLGEFLRD